MDRDHDSPLLKRTFYTYSTEGRLIGVTDGTGGGEQPGDLYLLGRPASSPVTFTRDQERRVFLVTGPDGKTEVFRDNPVRCLAVAPDPESGAMKLVMKYGRPTYLWRCREEREER